MKLLTHIATRLFNTPLLMAGTKLNVILGVLGKRIGLEADFTPPEATTTDPESPPYVDVVNNIAVIPIYGTLVRRTMGVEPESGLCAYPYVAANLEMAYADKDIKAIVLDIDSAGGEPSGLFDLADRIRAMSSTKPIWAVANDMAFSAAYLLASAAQKVIITRTGGVGSIGVIALHADQSGWDSHEGMKYTSVYAGARKNDFDPHQPITDEAKTVLQTEVNRIYGMLVDTIAINRNTTANAIRATEAALYFGPDAVTAGLADGVGTLESVISELKASLTTDQNPDPVPDVEVMSTDETPDLEQSKPAAEAITSTAKAIAIAKTCTLAGRPDLIAGFLERKTSLATVRTKLLAAKAKATSNIASLITNRPATRSQVDNPLISAAKQQAEKQAHKAQNHAYY